MKKLFAVILILGILFLSGCGGESGTSETGGKSKVNVDLTVLNDTMAYAQLENILGDPDKYFNKTIRASGDYSVVYPEIGGQHYHLIAIGDATACCQQQIEFIWKGKHEYPADYPAQGDKIEICGIFTSYTENGQKYYCIKTDDVVILSSASSGESSESSADSSESTPAESGTPAPGKKDN